MSRTRIKICGLTRWEDAEAALALGADYVGFVLYSGSPRAITALKLAQILDAVPAKKKAIGVFVNESRAAVDKIVADCDLYAVQLNGDENQSEFEGLGVPLWRSVRLEGDVCNPFPEEWSADRYVVDSSVSGLYGGTGKKADWKAAVAFAARYSTMLAGGLTPGNVAAAVKAVRPIGVDVASGVEKIHGIKDHAKMAAFIGNAGRAVA